MMPHALPKAPQRALLTYCHKKVDILDGRISAIEYHHTVTGAAAVTQKVD